MESILLMLLTRRTVLGTISLILLLICEKKNERRISQSKLWLNELICECLFFFFNKIIIRFISLTPSSKLLCFLVILTMPFSESILASMFESLMKFTIQVSASAAEQFKNELTILINDFKFRKMKENDGMGTLVSLCEVAYLISTTSKILQYVLKNRCCAAVIICSLLKDRK